MKKKQLYLCSNCNAEFSKWMGKCTNCNSWDTLVEQEVAILESKAAKQLIADHVELKKLADVQSDENKRISTTFAELDEVLGGGFVSEQVVLFSGEPGAGKSTLLLQVAAKLSAQGRKSLYVSGEESVGQVAGRARRLFSVEREFAELQFAASPGVHGLLAQFAQVRPEFVVIDSIQTMYDENLSSLPGSLVQVKSCTSLLVRAAKEYGFILVIVGHITKEGAIAGPKVLEHLVDTVLQFEGDRDGEYRMVRVLKNRFGFTGEVGLFVMTDQGLVDMDADHNLFDGGEESTVGAAKTIVLEGNRPIVVQVQALASRTVFAYPKRVAEGLSISRLQLICAILEKHANLQLADKDVYVRTTGGYSLQGHSSDLAVAQAIISSVLSNPIPGDTAYVGELSLNGRVMLPKNMVGKLQKTAKLGIKKLVSPVPVSSPGLKGVVVDSISKLK